MIRECFLVVPVLPAVTAALLLAGCGGGGAAHTPSVVTSAGDGRATMALTIYRATPSATKRRPANIPAQTAAIDARVYPANGAAATSAVSTSCVNFPAGATSATLTISVPLGTNTLSVSAYDGPCVVIGQGGTAGGTLLAQFNGTGTVLITSTDANVVYNGGSPLTLSKVLPVFPDAVPALNWSEIGPIGNRGESGKLQSYVRHPLQPASIWTAGGFGAGTKWAARPASSDRPTAAQRGRTRTMA